MHWDMVNGKGLADWDMALLTDVDVENVFQQLNVIKSREGALSRTRVCVARCRALAHSNGCEWLSGHSSAFCLQAAAEHKWHGVDCGRRNARRGLQWRHQGVQSDLQGDPPVFRHNLLFGHHVGPKRKCPGGLVARRKPRLGRCFGLHHAPEVQESGEMPSAPKGCAGGRGAGKRRDAVSTSAFRLRKQFRALCERVSSEAAFPDDAKKKLAEDDRSFAL